MYVYRPILLLSVVVSISSAAFADDDAQGKNHSVMPLNYTPGNLPAPELKVPADSKPRLTNKTLPSLDAGVDAFSAGGLKLKVDCEEISCVDGGVLELTSRLQKPASLAGGDDEGSCEEISCSPDEKAAGLHSKVSASPAKMWAISAADVDAAKEATKCVSAPVDCGSDKDVVASLPTADLLEKACGIKSSVLIGRFSCPGAPSVVNPYRIAEFKQSLNSPLKKPLKLSLSCKYLLYMVVKRQAAHVIEHSSEDDPSVAIVKQGAGLSTYENCSFTERATDLFYQINILYNQDLLDDSEKEYCDAVANHKD